MCPEELKNQYICMFEKSSFDINLLTNIFFTYLFVFMCLLP